MSSSPVARLDTGHVRLADDLTFGESYDFEKDTEIDPTVTKTRGHMTVLAYRPGIAPQEEAPQDIYGYLKGKYSWASLKVRICNDGMDVDEGEDESTSISVWPWALELRDGTLVTPFDEDLSGFPRPLYPTDDEDLEAGACRAGNIIFAVPQSQQVARVLYIRQGSLPVAWTDR
ncbi:hypothetical protein ACH4KC_11830 [Streptomyces griseoaurantiacus]|uniref:Uncharacterized protein n=2 Tax=Streptomyces griseoaurantiacus TaxID=68213 RepID=A0ABZ1V1B2_9ACTN|nr:hypothetical protein [Streptomyces jietaisiensis]